MHPRLRVSSHNWALSLLSQIKKRSFEVMPSRKNLLSCQSLIVETSRLSEMTNLLWWKSSNLGQWIINHLRKTPSLRRSNRTQAFDCRTFAVVHVDISDLTVVHSSRTLSHEDIQNHLTGRYFLPPSLLYSVARLTPDKQAYDVPVEGDWVTIAVVAERGEIKLTNPGPNGTKDDEEEEEGVDGGKKLKNGKPPPGKLHDSRPETEKEDYSRKRSKKFIHIKLVDLGHGSRSSSNNSSTSRGALRGDAQLNLLLFESDSFDVITDDVTRKLRKAWKGGSGGAFEECLTKLREGTVIALLNPKVLRPFQVR